MRHRHGTAFGNLFFKQRNHAAVTAQYIAEPDGYVIRTGTAVHGLDQHLAQALGRAHDIRGIHRFVCRDQDELVGTVAVCRLCHLIGAEYVIFNRLVRAVLHQGNVFMRCRMIYDVRAISLEDAVDALFISHRSDEHRKIQFRVLAKQLLLDIISIIFIDIQDNQLFRMVCRDLPRMTLPLT